jgi:hypothetical protein
MGVLGPKELQNPHLQQLKSTYHAHFLTVNYPPLSQPFTKNEVNWRFPFVGSSLHDIPLSRYEKGLSHFFVFNLIGTGPDVRRQ